MAALPPTAPPNNKLPFHLARDLSQVLSWAREDKIPPQVMARWLLNHGVTKEHVKAAGPYRIPEIPKEQREATLRDLPQALTLMHGMDPRMNRTLLEMHGIKREDVQNALNQMRGGQRRSKRRYEF